ncbi:MAG TPA: hypothetical protein VN689_03370, partial [Burkholderiales bacterium]|nr:hypothetical protein [Burkholderiales bacterium]
VMISPEHADIMRRGGLSKADVKAKLWELTKMPARHMAAKDLLRVKSSRSEELGEIGPDTLLTLSERPEDICIMVAGGPGTHSVYVPCFGNSRAITRAVSVAG